ncbi:Sec-independent protein translocase protein TatB [Salibaculum sp.]|uniref:Sec-independent protein translocase protein TatB n=1 Tax=Salibaculum sp. TaxID=2855480 RepID=UPI002B47BC2C|nr:Sec-independent protein translocase protein TatB [Salibaculum sp.]HKL68882.1 Sec-independent protein translocase protein TatB [Salibaculum sp.]
MPDIGWTELLVIGIVALIVVGPKDLPGLFRAFGRFTGKMRRMAREFSSAMNAAADSSGVKDIDKTIRAAANPAKSATDAVKNTAKSAMKPGGETERLSQERKEAAEKIRQNAARVAEQRMAREAAEAADSSEEPAGDTGETAPGTGPTKDSA